MNPRSKFVISWRQRKKVELIRDKGGKCEKCGYNKEVPAAFAFHHRDPKKKDFSISGKSWSLERLKKEAKKCDLLCVRCHAELHDEQHKEERERAFERHKKNLAKPPKKKIGCKTCSKQFMQKNKRQEHCCQECAKVATRRCKRPSKQELEKLLKRESWCAIGRKYGVSDNAIRKWARQYGLKI